MLGVFTLAAVVAALVTGCVYIDEFIVTQYDENGKEVLYSKANTEATFTLKGHIECHVRCRIPGTKRMESG